MRIRQMGFSSRLKAHRHLLTLETLKFIIEYLQDENAKQAAIRSGIPETYATRQALWLKKLPMVQLALSRDYDESDLRDLKKSLRVIHEHIEKCKQILGLNDET